MSGHSKWANIRRRKEKVDAQRGKIFTRLGREIMIAVKEGGPDPENNSKLRDAIAKAKAANMPNDSILRSIKKAGGEGALDNIEEITYEGYGPGGIAIIVETATDNRNRTAGEIRHYFDKYGGNLGQTGCVSFMFDKKGVIVVEKADGVNEDDLMIEALEAGAEDFDSESEYYEVLTSPENFSAVREALEKKGYAFVEAEIQMVPVTTTRLDDPALREKAEKLIENLENLDDVQNIWHNWEQDE